MGTVVANTQVVARDDQIEQLKKDVVSAQTQVAVLQADVYGIRANVSVMNVVSDIAFNAAIVAVCVLLLNK